MGFAIAEELHKENAELIIVSGPVNIQTNLPEKDIKEVTTALEMYGECQKHFNDVDIAIFTAAVADYRPRQQAATKIKKDGDIAIVEFVKNPDIAAEFGKIKLPHQISVGFALETDNVIQNAQKKMTKKGFDMIVINSPNVGEGFGYNTNKVSILINGQNILDYPLKSKSEVAKDITEKIKYFI
jgi:phosphopantothenoylcysteine decarboxylase/phosphopantothenate--cysteine ligase